MAKVKNLKQRKKAYEIWAWAEGKANASRIAAEVELTTEEVREFKVKDNWAERLKKDKKRGYFKDKIMAESENIPHQPERPEEIDHLQKILDEADIPDRAKLFVMFYLQSYNVKWSALQSGYSKHSAHVRGAAVMNSPKVIDTLNKIKKLMHENIHIRAYDIIDEYIKIAFADITEFVEFKDNKVTLRPSDEIDGRLVTEVKQGREGISIKLADKMKALERLEKLFEIIPDKRLELDHKKFELSEKLAGKAGEDGSKVTIINDIG